MTSGALKMTLPNSRAVLKNPNIDTKIVSLAFLEVTIAQLRLKLLLYTQVTSREVATFQSFSKGVSRTVGRHANDAIAIYTALCTI